LAAARRRWESIEATDWKHQQQCWSAWNGWSHHEPVSAGACCQWSASV